MVEISERSTASGWSVSNFSFEMVLMERDVIWFAAVVVVISIFVVNLLVEVFLEVSNTV